MYSPNHMDIKQALLTSSIVSLSENMITAACVWVSRRLVTQSALTELTRHITQLPAGGAKIKMQKYVGGNDFFGLQNENRCTDWRSEDFLLCLSCNETAVYSTRDSQGQNNAKYNWTKRNIFELTNP